ncbi:MAG: nuclear transport factor 2 family protein, partial [Solirubrobacterales bacterium]
FERCWPAHETIAGFEFVRLIERGEEVVITYESTKTDGRRFRNTEVQTFAGETIAKTEVYFGWDL